MKGLLRHIFPLSLRVRFLLATAGVVLVLSLAYGMVALVGYSVSFDKTTFRLLRGESNLFYMLAKWENGAIDVDIPENLNMESPTVTLIYDERGKLLWAQRDVPWLAKRIQPEWLKRNGFHEIEADVDSSSMLLRNNHEIQEQLDAIREQGDDSEMTHSVAINLYPATSKMPQLSIVVVDTIPVELKRSYMVWSWFIYVLAANLLLVIPLLWVAAWWSLRPIESLAKEVRELEEHHREKLNPNTTRELTRLVSNLNRLVRSERERYDKYRTTLTDLTHSLKTPLAVMQSTLRSLRGEKISVDEAEPVMTFVGEQNDFMEVMGNVLDNACKYCLEFVEVSVRQTTDSHLHILVEDDGPGIPQSQRRAVFDRGQRADTLRPGQGVGLSVAREIVEQYDGEIIASESLLGGACMEVVFGRQLMEDKQG